MSETVNHPGDDLEAYALGMLDGDERAAIDAHARDCDACAGRLGEAERTVAAMLEATLSPERLPRRGGVVRAASRTRSTARPLRYATAVAAAFALTAGLLGVQNATLHSVAQGDGDLMHALITTHFVHAQFRSPRGEPLDAKVLYERHGRWYAVLVAGSATAWRVATVERAGAAPRILPQTFVRTGGVGMLKLPATHALVTINLLDGEGRVVGTVATPQNGGR